MTRAPLSAEELGTLRGVTEAAAPNALVMIPRDMALQLLDMAEATLPRTLPPDVVTWTPERAAELADRRAEARKRFFGGDAA
jgi:hypothetical protein